MSAKDFQLCPTRKIQIGNFNQIVWQICGNTESESSVHRDTKVTFALPFFEATKIDAFDGEKIKIGRLPFEKAEVRALVTVETDAKFGSHMNHGIECGLKLAMVRFDEGDVVGVGSGFI